jgi:hypothetical protein
LDLTCRENQSTQIDFTNFFSVLATKFLSSLVIRKLSLQILDVTESHAALEFYLWTTAIIQDCFPSSLISQAQLQLVLTWPSPQPHNNMKALTCAFDAMSLPFLTQLQISTLDYIDSETWIKTFGKLPLLKRVCVQSSASYSFLEAFKLVHRQPRNLNFDIDLQDLDLFARDPLGYILVDMLLDCLMERCEREVRVLRLVDCYFISSDDVERLVDVILNKIPVSALAWPFISVNLVFPTRHNYRG